MEGDMTVSLLEETGVPGGNHPPTATVQYSSGRIALVE